MATLGSTAKPTDFIEWFGLNSVNQIGIALTLPAGGPWRIYELGAWLAGRGMSADYKLCLWTASGTLVRSSAGGTVASQAFALGNLANANQAITDYVVPGGTTVIVGIWRDPAHSVQTGYDSGGSHYHDTAGGSPGSLVGWSTHSGTRGYYLQYELANTAPNAPTIDEPDQNEVVNDTTPLIDWTFSDPDAGDSQTAYEVEIDNNSDFSSKVVDTGKVVSGTTSYTSGVALSRGTTYYVRVRTWDESDVVSPWSGTRTFKIAALPTATVTSPGTDTAAPLYYNAGSDTTPKLKPVWTFNCPDGGSQTSASVKVYDEAGTTLLHTHAHSGSAVTAEISGFSPTNGTKYQISVTPVCSHGPTGSESAKKRCRVRWGRASYRADLGSAPTTLSSTVSSTLNSGQVVMEYASSAATTPEPTDWKATIAEVTKQRYVWHRVTLLPQVVASPTSPTLNSVVFSYSANVLVPDGWTLDSQFTIDEGTFVYGTQSLKHTGDGTTNTATQDVPVTPNTQYIFSGRVKTDGAAGITMRIEDPADGSLIADVAVPSSTDWDRYATTVFDSGARSVLRIKLQGTGAASTFAWFDALKLEASTVVTPWTPGFLGSAVVIDALGLSVDKVAGGAFRLRGSTGGTRDVVELHQKGLRFGGDTEIWSPSTGLVNGTGRLRYVPIAPTTVINFASTSATISQTSLELTDLPSSGVVMAHVLAFVNCSIIANGNNFQVFGYEADRSTVQSLASIAVYGTDTTASVYDTTQGMVSTGSTNNRTIRYSVPRASGTIVYGLRLYGYWTTE